MAGRSNAVAVIIVCTCLAGCAFAARTTPRYEHHFIKQVGSNRASSLPSVQREEKRNEPYLPISAGLTAFVSSVSHALVQKALMSVSRGFDGPTGLAGSLLAATGIARTTSATNKIIQQQESVPLLQRRVYVDAGWQYMLQARQGTFHYATDLCEEQGMRLPQATSHVDQRAIKALCSGGSLPSTCWLSQRNGMCTMATAAGSLPITASPCDAIRAVICVSVDPAVAIATDYQEHDTETDTAATQLQDEDQEPALMADGEYQDAAYYDSWERAELEINQFADRAREAEEELERNQKLAAHKKEYHLRGNIGDATIDLVAKGSTTETGTHFSAGNQYMLQDREASYQDAMDLCQAQNMDLAGTEWLPDLTAITLLCGAEGASRNGCWLVYAEQPEATQEPCTYRTVAGAVAYSSCQEARSFVCVTRQLAADMPHEQQQAETDSQHTAAVVAANDEVVEDNTQQEGAEYDYDLPPSMKDMVSRAITLGKLQDRSQLMYEEDGLMYLLMDQLSSYKVANEFCTEYGVDIAGIDWSADRHAMKALCSNSTLAPNGCWLYRSTKRDEDETTQDTCMYTTGEYPGVSGPCDVARSFACVFMPTMMDGTANYADSDDIYSGNPYAEEDIYDTVQPAEQDAYAMDSVDDIYDTAEAAEVAEVAWQEGQKQKRVILPGRAHQAISAE